MGYELIPVANYLPSDVDRDRTPEIARQFAMAFAALRRLLPSRILDRMALAIERREMRD